MSFILLIAAFVFAANQSHAQGYLPVLVTTFTNPTPMTSDRFSDRMAALGSNCVLIGTPGDDTGATNAGAAYLFRTDGALLTTFNNPDPSASGAFGGAITAVGADRVLIGAFGNNTNVPLAGAAYLFSTNGVLLTTFTNPAPVISGHFGTSVAALDGDRVIVGADGNVTGTTDAGAAFLFRTDGVLLATFTNPAPASLDRFGGAVAAVGSDLVLVGAWRDDAGATDAGAAYLFSTNGLLLRTFTNPTPAAGDYFGSAVAAVGNDRVLIGAYGDNAGAADAGVAYLFRTNGTLLTTLTNPTPAVGDVFGFALTALGNDRVLIGSLYDDTGATNAGAVYLFSTNGVLLATLTKPSPVNEDMFGNSVAAVGNDQVVVGAWLDNTGAQDTGAAYLFRIAPPLLQIRLTITNTVIVSWPSSTTGFTLQQNTNGVSSLNWSNVSGAIQDDGVTKTFLAEPSIGESFYRLFKP